MGILLIAGAALCFLAFLFAISPWLGFAALLFVGGMIALQFQMLFAGIEQKKPAPPKRVLPKTGDPDLDALVERIKGQS